MNDAESQRLRNSREVTSGSVLAFSLRASKWNENGGTDTPAGAECLDCKTEVRDDRYICAWFLFVARKSEPSKRHGAFKSFAIRESFRV